MKRIALAIAIVILPATLPVRAGASSLPGEELFKWGEYDSLIRLLEPVGTMAPPATAADSADRAKSYLFLGVAYFATGKKVQADSAFASACSLDPQVKLDRFYVTEEIANRFQAIAPHDTGRRQPEREVRAVPAEAAYKDAAAPESPIASDRTSRVRRRGGQWVWWGLGTTALGASGVTILWIMSREESPSENIISIDARQ